MCSGSRRATTRWWPPPATPCATCGRWQARAPRSPRRTTRCTRGWRDALGGTHAMTTLKVGFVGLGAMGLPMTRNLLEAGHTVTVASRSRGPVDAALKLGALDGGDPAGVARASEIVVICVPNSPEVVEVVDAMLAALGTRHVVVDCSTIDPDVERAQHDRVTASGAGYLEAPLSGGTVGAENGTLTLMVGGEAETLERARPALDAFSARIVHCGGPGMGQVVKLCNNLISAAQMVATAAHGEANEWLREATRYLLSDRQGRPG